LGLADRRGDVRGMLESRVRLVGSITETVVGGEVRLATYSFVLAEDAPAPHCCTSASLTWTVAAADTLSPAFEMAVAFTGKTPLCR